MKDRTSTYDLYLAREAWYDAQDEADRAAIALREAQYRYDTAAIAATRASKHLVELQDRA